MYTVPFLLQMILTLVSYKNNQTGIQGYYFAYLTIFTMRGANKHMLSPFGTYATVTVFLVVIS